jgi:hypothetical protein
MPPLWCFFQALLVLEGSHMEELHGSLTTFEDTTNYNLFTLCSSCSCISLHSPMHL